MRSVDGRHRDKRRVIDGRVNYMCNQGGHWKPAVEFKRGGKRRQDCNACAERGKLLYAGNMTMAERIAAIKVANPRIDRKVDAHDGPRVIFRLKSGNKKLGPIPVSISEPGTCPRSCTFYDVGCYAGYGWNGTIWRKARQFGLPWRDFLDAVEALPDGQVWRHNEAGDLAGGVDAIHEGWFWDLIVAAKGTRGFTYTHRTIIGSSEGRINARLIRDGNAEGGMTINLSADTLEQADEYADLGIGPVVVTLPDDIIAGMYVTETHYARKTKHESLRHLRPKPKELRTPKGRRVVICPAQTAAKLTCAECQLCAHPHRKSVVGFVAHGQGSRLVSELIRSKRPVEHEGRATA